MLFKKSQETTNKTTNDFDNLWTNFTSIEGNDVWVDEPEKVQVASLKVAKKIQAKGLDPG